MTELEKTYDPKLVEEKWYTFWEAGHFFEANPNSQKEPFCVMIPPPNVTGVLHMGHALVDTLIDIISRYKRMKGFEVLWQPGTDHAGISTQTVVEKHLIATQGKTRKEFSRSEFLTHVWRWKEQSESTIINQLKRLGCSADWSRIKFTMDPDLNAAVRRVFKEMYTSGLIYRGDYLVHWDPVTQTALADDEVEYEEHISSLWHFAYPVEGGGTITIATTRPETMLGDTAVAVAPKDERYKHLIGKSVILPLSSRKIPIIEDHYVVKSFGSGAVKITPAHDPNDYEIGMRHSLPMVNIMTPDGKINENGGKFEGLSMQEARKAVVQAMKDLGHLVHIEPHTHRVGVSYRSKAIIEPYLSKQWFVKLSSFKETLLEAVSSKRVELVPEYWEATYTHWITNLRDWCISRQLWWGHQIPIWYHKNNPDTIICYDGEGLPPEVERNPADWYQDPDVLDTWFSSALWPFSTLGWPKKTPELSKFYPNATLFTGHDILFFWVARMIFMGEYVMGEIPFKKAFLHGLIYGKSYWRMDTEQGVLYVPQEEKRAYDLGEPLPNDVLSKWEKMSKSKGNVIDPLEIIDTYGTDAMRMALTASATHARQIDLDRRRFEEYKNFANKVWNGARFVFMNLTLTPEELQEGIDPSLLTLDDRWILSKMNRTIQTISDSIEKYTFDYAATASYEFYWNDFCANYVESTKPYLFGKVGTESVIKNKKRILAVVLGTAIRLMHPMAPFITEELFQKLKTHFAIKHGTSSDPYVNELILALKQAACIIAPYPEVCKSEDISPTIEEEYAQLSSYVYAIRNIRAEMGMPPSEKSTIYLNGSKEKLGFLQTHEATLRALVPIDEIHYDKRPQETVVSHATISEIEVIIPLSETLLEKERIRLTKLQEKLEKSVQSLSAKLENANFIERAPQQLVEQTKKDLEEAKKQVQEISSKLTAIR